jgi:hypothetical protein
MSGAKVTRDGLLFVVGLAGIAYETVVVHVDRPVLLALFGGMVGLPAFFRADEKRKDDAAERTEAREARADVHDREDARYEARRGHDDDRNAARREGA